MQDTIKNYSDYKRFIREDARARNQKSDFISYISDDVWRFQRLLRYLEYLENSKSHGLNYVITKVRFRKLSRKLGFSIPTNVFGPGLRIAHPGTIVVSRKARVGKNCTIHICVNIGADFHDSSLAPHLGDNCYIGPGAKIFGGITLGDNTRIGANAVVNRDAVHGNCTLVGVPARSISQR